MLTREEQKRKKEGILLFFLGALFIALTIAEFQLTRIAHVLPFVNSIFFFGLLNINIIILIGLIWLIFRNIGKLFLERRRRVLGARLKTRLVLAFCAFSIIPTLMLFFISALYINSSFDKWFSLKIQNTLEASLEITHTYYKNTDQTATHFARHLADEIRIRCAQELSRMRMSPALKRFLRHERELFAIDALEFYYGPFFDYMMAEKASQSLHLMYKKASGKDLDKVSRGEFVSVVEAAKFGDIIRSFAPVWSMGEEEKRVIGIVVVNFYVPLSLRTRVDEIASVYDDYKGTNPLKYPMKTTYLVILIMITLVIVFVAIWIGLFMARELTDPVARLVQGATEVGSGNLDVEILSAGFDEIAVLVGSFNKMTKDLRDNRERLNAARFDLEKRSGELEAILANIETGVLAVGIEGDVTLFNDAVGELLGFQVLHRPMHYRDLPLSPELMQLLDKAFSCMQKNEARIERVSWSMQTAEGYNRTLSATATRVMGASSHTGVVVVIDDVTRAIHAQREMAWREVARRIAHEIKNPLTPIKLSAQRLKRRFRDHGGPDGALLAECTDTIVQHTDALKEMVDEFSNFARLPEVSPAPADIVQALTEVLGLYEQAHPSTRFVKHFQTVPVFDFDYEQMKRVFINLCDNAIAACSEHAAIEVTTRFDKELELAIVEFSDNGPGMPEEVRVRVFEPYFSTKKEGTGLGLAIVKRIINDHDGFIRVRSVPGGGTHFVIELPTTLRFQQV